MARLSQLALLLAYVAAVTAAPATSGRVHAAPSVIPSMWKQGAAAPAAKTISFDLIFAPKDVAGLEARMLEISNSKSAWMTEEEIAAYIVPSNEDKAAVETALKGIGATDLTYSRNGDTLTVTTTIAQASKFFNAQFFEYTNSKTIGTFYKATEFTVPASIEAQIADVSSFATFASSQHLSHMADLTPEERVELEKRATPSSCSTSAVTSACIRALYGFDTYTPTTSTGTARLGIMAYIGQSFSQTDLKTYLTKFRPEAAAYTIPVTTIAGATNSASNPGVEAALDTQTAAGIIYPLPSQFYDYGTSSTAGDIFLLTFQYFLGLAASSRPSVITISYGSLESAFTSSQATSMCNAAQQLAAAGMTIVVSSGDDGVSGQGGTCPPFQPTYPGGCPYILSVGATQSFSPEVMVDTSLAGFYSGAGLSNRFTTPSYQTSVVSAYETALGTTASGDYNKSGRAFPDVSAQGSRQDVVVKGVTELVGGTSASAPIVASGLTLLNDLLITAGKATVGWANPTFYANPSAFTDVTSGGSFECGRSTTLGLPAKTGWDASAGLGTPIFSGLRTVYGV
ncbi:subtilisin-like protein [Clavulina sp. PMI_390]|nr:subtilisin-like protein [Clavulina sp. PMI_390]